MTNANKIAFVLCCTALVFTTVAYGGVHQPIIAIFYVLVVLAGVAWASDRLVVGKLGLSSETLQIPLMGATIYAFIQIIPLGSRSVAGLEGIPNTISLDPFATWTTALQLIAFSIFFTVLLTSLSSAVRIRRFFSLIAVFGFFFAFFAILQSVVSPEKIYGIYDVSLGAPYGSFVNRNSFAAYMEMAAALPLGLVFVGAVIKEKRLLYITAIALMGVSLLLCRSRGGLVAFIAELILLFFLTRQSTTRKNILLRAGLVILLIFAIIAGAIFVGGDTSLTRFADTASSNDLSSERAHIWSVTTKVIAANMPLGAGFGAFAVAYTPFDDASGLARVEQAHNDYLQVLADAGIPGLILGLLFLFFFFRHGRNISSIRNAYRRGIALGAFAGCFAVLVHSIFDFVLHVTAVALLFLSLMALLSASKRAFPDDIDDESKHRRRKRIRRNEDTGEGLAPR
jgi:O-antigen ligase